MNTLHNEEHCNINRLATVMIVTSRRLQWSGHIAGIRGKDEYIQNFGRK